MEWVVPLIVSIELRLYCGMVMLIRRLQNLQIAKLN